MKKILIIFALFFSSCATLQVYKKPPVYTNGIIIHAKKDIKIKKILVNNGECKMRLVAYADIADDGQTLILNGVKYLPKMQNCSEIIGKLDLEVLKNESNFDVITYDNCDIKSVYILSDAGEFLLDNIPTAEPKLIEKLSDESQKIRPIQPVDEHEFSEEELNERASTCQPY